MFCVTFVVVERLRGLLVWHKLRALMTVSDSVAMFSYWLLTVTLWHPEILFCHFSPCMADMQ